MIWYTIEFEDEVLEDGECDSLPFLAVGDLIEIDKARYKVRQRLWESGGRAITIFVDKHGTDG